jgi:DNA-binding NtrC family response regulator
MSTAEVIDELKKLPVREQAKVLRVLSEQLRAALTAQPPVEYAGDAEFEAAMKKVLEENAGLMRRLAQ